MKKVTVFRRDGDDKIMKVTINAPEDKEIVFDPALLQHGVLSLGEYGPSGIKIAAFNRWDQAVFLNGDEGYTVEAKVV